MTCKTCNRALRPKHAVATDYPGTVRSEGGYCASHSKRERARQATIKRGPRREPTKVSPERAEDMHFLAQTGETLTGAARRLGVTIKTATRLAERCGGDVMETFRTNEYGTMPNGVVRY